MGRLFNWLHRNLRRPDDGKGRATHVTRPDTCRHAYFPVKGVRPGTFIGQHCPICDHFNPLDQCSPRWGKSAQVVDVEGRVAEVMARRADAGPQDNDDRPKEKRL